MGLCQDLLRTKLLEREKVKDRPLGSDSHMYVCVFYVVGVVICCLCIDWLRWCSLPRNLPSPSCLMSGEQKWQRKREIPCSLDWNDVGGAVQP